MEPNIKNGDDGKLNIAIIGGGISGMSCAYLLTMGGHNCTVFEKGNYLGGHTNTVQVKFQEETVKIDTGFLVYTPQKYPNLMTLFKRLGIKNGESDMSFGYSLNARQGIEKTVEMEVVANEITTNPIKAPIRREIEWCSDNLSTIFAQWQNLFRPSFWRLLIDLYRFSKDGPLIVTPENLEKYKNMSVRQYCEINGYSRAFIEYYLIPVASAVWSTSFKEVDLFPIVTLARFFQNHGLFKIVNRPQWNSVQGGSYQYMEKIKEFLESNGGKILLSSPVSKVVRSKNTQDGVFITTTTTTTNGTTTDTATTNTQHFDRVVFACHTPDIFPMLTDMTYPERKVLSGFKFTHCLAYLHSDPLLMPRRRSTWSSWNYIYDDSSLTENKLCCTYWLNRIQPWVNAEKYPLYLTLNPVFQPNPSLLHRVIEYDHPLICPESDKAKSRLPTIQGIRNSFYCGAWTGYGFHEDGITSGLLAAQLIDPSLNKLWKVDVTRYIDEFPSNPDKTTLTIFKNILYFSTLLTLIYYSKPILNKFK
ncbi:hypothetical protein DDB_G0267592 [Dictyostelium discoideum AX4]|uniref:Amine oxidase domain-containing protein n=1 Tax=Dictyostelium discoideum TaxID=44689 RepID=Q55GN4_DICDI|nr:hypothetical protein DDB_G0267592 [Dictyostelium discoideum AX4]EAL73249.1 hypothetical protein DDB_G0267592 [Dictyostelium discoideum AX4]|eukprot:XP_647150.1 hypothetical protein DDB_G0267592 [Dictyostelium discoideum AX4]